MEALKLSFPKTISFIGKTAVSPVPDQALFASLMNSLSAEAELASEEQPPELLDSLDSLLALLQELPVEEQTAEQQELQYAVLQLQGIQVESEQAGFTARSLTVGTEKLLTEAADKLIGLLENIQQKLQILSGKFTTEFADSPVFKGAAEKNSPNFSTLTQISKQLGELIGILEKQVQATSGLQQGKAISQELPPLPRVEEVKPVKELPRFLDETLKPVKELVKVPVEIQGTPLRTEPAELQASRNLVNMEEPQSPKAPVESKAPQEPTLQPTVSLMAEAGKAAGSQVRTEANASPVTFVRLANLLEDLGGMLKSSMRMAETAEGMKMRVNIFPEHLGHLEILLTSTNGKLAAQIMASTPMAKEALELQLNQLRISLVQQGVAVEKIEVLQQSSQQAFNQQQSNTEQRFTQQHRNGSTKQDKNGYLQQEEEKTAERQPSVGRLMKVDYTV
ncbi:flagellar hook-length control protein FliK [Planococcus sp. SE5232]|uniref:flagellar hook-length control protein FliK n=1 Tax=unclassified Planococcus (in: firmicutes) TaxID=2662419 RepID=UPI003D6A0833